MKPLVFKSKTQGTKSKVKGRRSSYTRGATPVCTKPGEEDNSRLFVLDWETPTQSNDVIKTVKESNSKLRHKSMRPSTANTLFLL